MRSPIGEPRTHWDWGSVQSYQPFDARLVEPTLAPDVEVGSETAADSEKGVGVIRFPSSPPSGRITRDKPILDLEPQLLEGSTVLVHGPAGSGKTQLASELAEWANRTAAIDGPAIYTDFSEHRGIASLLDSLAGVFGSALRANGIDWEPMDEQQRLEATLLILSQIPVLWVWDSFESISSKAEASMRWSEEERDRLLQFLDLTPDTQARVLILSRTEERWLGSTVKAPSSHPMERPRHSPLGRFDSYRGQVQVGAGALRDDRRCGGGQSTDRPHADAGGRREGLVESVDDPRSGAGDPGGGVS